MGLLKLFVILLDLRNSMFVEIYFVHINKNVSIVIILILFLLPGVLQELKKYN